MGQASTGVSFTCQHGSGGKPQRTHFLQHNPQALLAWSERWDSFLAETSIGEDGKARLTHERLVKARRSLVRLVNAGTIFTYLDPALAGTGVIPSTNNRIEGGVNAQLRAMLRDHRGLSIERRLKAIFWWCYVHSPSPLPAAE